jgi:hypothetical protein
VNAGGNVRVVCVLRGAEREGLVEEGAFAANTEELIAVHLVGEGGLLRKPLVVEIELADEELRASQAEDAVNAKVVCGVDKVDEARRGKSTDEVKL